MHFKFLYCHLRLRTHLSLLFIFHFLLGQHKVVAIFIDDDYGRNSVAELDDALAVGHIKISHKVRIPPSSEVSWGCNYFIS
ncbi:hypothetical protein CsSME_00036456 [Camellia sinensis var. sinensis]